MRRTVLFMARRKSWVAALVLLLVAFTAAPVTAQVTGLYYKEVEKDGRIYIFNTPERFQSWSLSNDMGTAVTLLGRGPNGETLVGENDTAIDLYLFKHNLDAYERPPAPKPPAPAKQWYEQIKVGGYFFGDAYYVSKNHDKVAENQVKDGFWLRRGYLTIDSAISDTLNARLRWEVNGAGDFRTGSNLTPFVKDAYLSWKHAKQEYVFGISPTPTFELLEGFWGYRFLEKTPADLYRIGASRDFGAAAKGALGSSGKLRYHAMVGNGSGQGAETDKYKKAMLSVSLAPTSNWLFEAYGDSEKRPDKADRTTFRAFGGYTQKKGRVGVDYIQQTRKNPSPTGDDLKLDIVSIFGVLNLSEKVALVARADRALDPIPGANGIAYVPIATTHEFDFLLAGVDFKLNKKVNLSPNIEFVKYRDTDGVRTPKPDNDLYGRLTLYVQF